jgi:hypothetical protein
MILETFEQDRLQDLFPHASHRALQRVPAESVNDADKVAAHIELWAEAEARASMLSMRTLKLSERYGARLPGDGASTFAEHAEGFAYRYLGAIEKALDRGAGLTHALLDETFIAALRDVRKFETLIENARTAGNPALHRTPANAAAIIG